MSELISKRRLEEALICGLCRSEKTDDYKNGLWDALRVAEAIEPVNAVELPCKIGDEVFEPSMKSGTIYSRTVKGFTVSERIELINCETKNFYWFEIGEKVFLTREEAEKALEDLKNENK